MKTPSIISFVTILAWAASGCTRSASIPDRSPSDSVAVQRIHDEMGRIVAATGVILEPLRTMNQEQQTAVVSLALLVQGVDAYQVSRLAPDTAIVADFHRALVGVSPLFARVRDPVSVAIACMDEHIAYVSALASCESEDPPRQEDECHEAWGPGARLAHCLWPALQDLEATINGLIGQLDPPRPQPFPEILNVR